MAITATMAIMGITVAGTETTAGMVAVTTMATEDMDIAINGSGSLAQAVDTDYINNQQPEQSLRLFSLGQQESKKPQMNVYHVRRGRFTLMSDFCLPISAIRPPASVLRHPASAFRPLASGLWLLASGLCHPPSAPWSVRHGRWRFRLGIKLSILGFGTMLVLATRQCMNLPTPIRQTIDFVKALLSFPQAVGFVLKQRRQQVAIDEQEAERLDRIRNPSKYLGKG